LRGITVNAVAPGFVATEMTQELDEAQRQQIARRSALKRLADPIEVARGVEFLLGDGGRNITGTTLAIDAGKHGVMSRGALTKPLFYK
jgi:3-oxoacyl-[acyl-carrier protein] reductase